MFIYSIIQAMFILMHMVAAAVRMTDEASSSYSHTKGKMDYYRFDRLYYIFVLRYNGNAYYFYNILKMVTKI